MIETLIFAAVIAGVVAIVRGVGRIQMLPTVRVLQKQYRTRRPPCGEESGITVWQIGGSSRLPVKRAELSAQGISIWYTVLNPFNVQALYLPWSAVREAWGEHYPNDTLDVGHNILVHLEWEGSEVIRELGVVLPCAL